MADINKSKEDEINKKSGENSLIDLTGYESDLEDIVGGRAYRKLQTGVELTEDEWEKYPGQELVDGRKEEDAQAEYPLLLLNYRTVRVQKEIEEILEQNAIKNSDLFDKIDDKHIKMVNIYKSWEDGSVNYMGKGILTHERWTILDSMGLRPTLYTEKGISYRAKSGILFDYGNYKPIILKEEEKDEFFDINNPDYDDDYEEWEMDYDTGRPQPDPNTYTPRELTTLTWTTKPTEDNQQLQEEMESLEEYSKEIVDEEVMPESSKDVNIGWETSNKENIKEEIKEETDQEIKEETDQEIKEETDQEIKEETDPKIANLQEELLNIETNIDDFKSIGMDMLKDKLSEHQPQKIVSQKNKDAIDTILNQSEDEEELTYEERLERFNNKNIFSDAIMGENETKEEEYSLEDLIPNVNFTWDKGI